MALHGEFMGDPRVEEHSRKMVLIGIIDRFNLEISSYKGKRAGLKNKKTNMLGEFITSVFVCIVSIILCIYFAEHSLLFTGIYAFDVAGAMKAISSLLLFVFITLLIAYLIPRTVEKWISYGIFTEQKIYRKYIFNHSIGTYFVQYDNYTNAIIELEKRRRKYSCMLQKLDEWESLTEDEIKTIDSFSSNELKYKLAIYPDFRIRFTELFDIIRGR